MEVTKTAIKVIREKAIYSEEPLPSYKNLMGEKGLFSRNTKSIQKNSSDLLEKSKMLTHVLHEERALKDYFYTGES